MGATDTTRRAILGGAGLAAIGTLSPAVASAMPAMSTARDPEWNRIVSRFERAHPTMKQVGKEYGAAEAAYQTEKALLGDRPAKPRIEYPRPIVDMTVGEMRDLDLAVSTEKQEQYEAALATWTARESALRQRVLSGVEERWNTAVGEQERAVQAVFAHPAPDAAAMRYKLDLAEREYRGFDLDQDVTAQIFADVRRLMLVEA